MKDSLDTDLRNIEAQLTNLNPTKMSDDMISRMEQAMISWEINLPAEEKIVPLNDAEHTMGMVHTSQSSSKMHLWGAAAAVALLTGVASVFMASTPESPSIAADDLTNSEDSILATVPSPEFSRNIIHASNEGFTYSNNNDEAFKVLRIEYTEKASTHDGKGNATITEKPCIEHVLVPVPVH